MAACDSDQPSMQILSFSFWCFNPCNKSKVFQLGNMLLIYATAFIVYDTTDEVQNIWLVQFKKNCCLGKKLYLGGTNPLSNILC